MPTTLADQSKAKRMQLAAQGSRSKVNLGAKVRLQCQEIDEEWYFDVANISNYGLILGKPWIFQHQVTISLNPSPVIIGCVALSGGQRNKNRFAGG